MPAEGELPFRFNRAIKSLRRFHAFGGLAWRDSNGIP